MAQDLQTGVSETGETVIIQPGKPNAPKYQVGQAIRFTSIYPTPDALINEHLSAEALWTQVEQLQRNYRTDKTFTVLKIADIC